MANFASHQRLRDDSDHFPALRKHGVGQHAHQADVAAAIDEIDAALHQQGCELLRCGRGKRGDSQIGTAEHANSSEMSWP